MTFHFSTMVGMTDNGSGIAEVGGDPAIAGVKPPNEAEKAAYLQQYRCWPQYGLLQRVLLNYRSRWSAINKTKE